MKPVVNAIIGISIIFLATTLGAALVFIFRKKKISATLNKIIVGFAGGIMLSASIFSLINPALETEVTYMPSWLVVALSVLLGGLFLWGIDKLVPHLHIAEKQEEGIPTRKVNKTTKMFLAVTIHNIPEGLSVGIAYGVALALLKGDATNPAGIAALSGALMLSIGIAIQNVPEGTAVSLPIQSETGNSGKAFLFGMFSGVVEPIAAIGGLFLAYFLSPIMPWALGFAAGAMIYVIIEEMVPEASEQENEEKHNHYGVWAFMIAFVLMMILDSAL